MVGVVVKSKVDDLEEDIRMGFLGRLRKEITGVVQEVVGKRKYLVRGKYGLEKDMLLNHITIVLVRSELEEDIEVREVDMITELR